MKKPTTRKDRMKKARARKSHIKLARIASSRSSLTKEAREHKGRNRTDRFADRSNPNSPQSSRSSSPIVTETWEASNAERLDNIPPDLDSLELFSQAWTDSRPPWFVASPKANHAAKSLQQLPRDSRNSLLSTSGGGPEVSDLESVSTHLLSPTSSIGTTSAPRLSMANYPIPPGDSEDNDGSEESDDDGESPNAMPEISSDLLHILGVNECDISSLGKEDAIQLSSKLHEYLRSSSVDSAEYASALKLLQDLCLFTGELPSSFQLKDVTFDRKDVIGRGGEATVYLGQMGQQKVVVREVVLPPREWNSPLGRKVAKLVHREAITHSQLHHPNILSFLGVFYEAPGSPPIMALPFAENGALSDLLREGSISNVQFGQIVTGISLGVAYLHSRNPPIVHGDIHPGNVLLDARGTPFLCDFGLSRIRHEVTRTRTMIHEGGHIRFLAPELSAGITTSFRTTQASDIFALSMTFLNAWTQQPPFCEIRNEVKVAASLRKGRRPKRPVTPMAINMMPEAEQEFWNLLAAMWEHEPSIRPSSEFVRNYLEHLLCP